MTRRCKIPYRPWPKTSPVLKSTLSGRNILPIPLSISPRHSTTTGSCYVIAIAPFHSQLFNHAPRPLDSNCFALYESIRMDISTAAVVPATACRHSIVNTWSLSSVMLRWASHIASKHCCTRWLLCRISSVPSMAVLYFWTRMSFVSPPTCLTLI